MSAFKRPLYKMAVVEGPALSGPRLSGDGIDFKNRFSSMRGPDGAGPSMKISPASFPNFIWERPCFRNFIVSAALFFLTATSCLAAATLGQQIDPPQPNVGDDIAVTYTLQGGRGEVRLPNIDGLQLLGSSSSVQMSIINMSVSSTISQTFHLVASRAGDFTIPAFDVRLSDGGTLHTREMKVHVGGTNTVLGPTPAPAPGAAPMPIAPPNAVPAPPPGFNPNGPVVYPNNNQTPTATPPNSSDANAPPNPGDASTANNPAQPTVPTEADGRPAKVFIIITPQTTDAYVGQSIPMGIDFYIRQDADAQQDSLPTIKGSDFLMNNLSVRFRVDGATVNGESYRRERWQTAISAPKSGDFPLQMERDTYWRKMSPGNSGDPFTNFFPTRPDLAHEAVPSNQFTIHVHTLPDDGRPANFTGAIGQFTATGSAQPKTVGVGDPVTLHFTVSGEGNFDYVRCPALPEDPAWKTYVPSSKTDYGQDETRTQATKTFEMAVIPQKNGAVPLPQASFSYFDPTTKKYATIPIDLGTITVTGSASANPAAPSAPDAAATASAAPSTSDLSPNRVDSGSPRASLAPVFWQSWYWIVQGALLGVVLLGSLVLLLRSRVKPDTGRAERLERQNSLDRELDAMNTAREKKDALAFFLAARHAVQLHLATQWKVKPETLTLTEIRDRDPALAESLEPLFRQADEIIYSGGVGTGLDLAQWQRHVLELLQPQSQPAKS